MKAFLLLGLFVMSGFISPNLVMLNDGAYHTQKGEVGLHFDLMVGKMKANTNEASSSLDIKSEAVIFNMKVKSFEFDNSIIEQQFKEVYMEADKFPDTSFMGKIKKGVNFNTKAAQHVDVEGTLAMHGINKKRTIPAVITVLDGNRIHVKSEFTVLASEHSINIPSAFFSNGKDEIKVVLDAIYEKK
jgi:polyisoprenoid-binding protein YceI